MTAKLNTVKLPRALVALLMAFAILLGTVATGLAVLETDAASSTYNLTTLPSNAQTCASGTVTWQMIKDNPNSYYWYYSKGNVYCVLNATGSGSSNYVTVARPDKSDTRYLKNDSNDDSGSSDAWKTYAYSGGVLYYVPSIPASTLTLSKSTLNIVVDNTGTNIATCSNCYVSGASSNNTSVASVTYSGNTITVTGIAPGTATITVSGKSNNSSSYTDPTSKTFTVYVTGKYYGQLQYDANGGNGAPASSAITGSSDTYASSANVSIQISDTIPTKEGYNFLGWSTNSSATSADYQPGATYTITSSKSQIANPEKVTLYAVWEDKIKVSNPSEVGDYSTKNLHISKELTKKDDGTYTIKIVTYGTKQTTTSTVNETKTMYAIQTGKSYTYSELSNGKYYYRDGTSSTAYPITGYAYSSSRYYLTYVKNGTTYYITESGSTTSRSSGTYASSTSGTILSNYSSGQIYSIEPQTYTAGESYVEVSNSSNIAYNTIVNTPYYYKSGTQYYQLLSYSSSSKYYVYYYDGSKYYGLKKDASTSSSSSDRTKGTSVKNTTSTLLEAGFKTGYIYQKVSSSGGSATPTALSVPTQVTTTTGPSISSGIIKDIIETSNFDVSNAQYKVTTQTVNYSGSLSGSETQINTGSVSSNGIITTPSFNYSSNAASSSTTGTAEILTISGLELKDGIYGDALPSNKGNAGIFENATTATPEVSITSPTVSVPKPENPTYTVTWKNYDGTVLKTDSELEDGTTPSYSGTSPTKPSDAQYTYTFSGWSPNITEINGANQEYTAQYTATTRTYTVTWKDSDGNNLTPATSTVAYGSRPTHTEPTKADDDNYTYTFKGWTTTQDGSGEVYKTSELPAVTGNVTYYAQFDKKEKEASYELTVEDITYCIGNLDSLTGTHASGDLGNSIYAYPNFTLKRNGTYLVDENNNYSGVGFFTKNGNYQFEFVSDNQSIVENTENDNWIVIFNTPGISTVTLNVYERLNGAEGDIRNTENGKLVASETFTVTVYPFNITFKNGDTTLEETSAKLKEVPTYSGETPSKEGYTFVGWSTNPDADPNSTEGGLIYTDTLPEATDNTTYYAIFKENETYTVTWMDWDGTTVLDTTEYKKGDKPSYIPTHGTPTKASDEQYTYTFGGWSSDSGQSYGTADASLEPVTGNKTWYASFYKNTRTYTVKWVDDDGTPLETDEQVPYGTMPTYDSAQPSKKADAQYKYSFIGWSPVVSSVTGDVTYTANYDKQLQSYNVTFRYLDEETDFGDEPGEVDDTKTYNYGQTPIEPDVPKTITIGNTTYTFKGWDKTISEVTGETLYTAQYNEETFIPETDASTDKKLLPAVTLLTMLATAATAAVLAADPRRRRRRRDSE